MGIDGDAEHVRRTSSSVMARAVCIAGVMLLTLGNSGCSYAFVHGPRSAEISAHETEQPEPTKLECTSSNAVPIVDTFLAVPLIGVGVLGIVAGADSGSCTGWCVGPSSGEAIAIGAAMTALGTLALSSAITGYGRTADCRRAEEALPAGPHQVGRHLLDVKGIVEARARDAKDE